jgi:hypothetical protein
MKLRLTFVTSLILSLFSVCSAQTLEFPDPAFKTALLENGVDLDKDKEIQANEAEAILVLDLSSKSINDLTGIEAFKNLEELACNWNNLTFIDVSKNDSLKILYIAGNKLTKIDLSNNLNLISLGIDENPITGINLTLNEKLTKLTITKTNITSLDLTKNLKLLQLNCSDNLGLQFVTVPVVNAAMSNKKFKKGENTQWTEKSKVAPGQGQGQRR